MNEEIKEYYLRHYKRLCRAETYAKVELQNYLENRNVYSKPDMSGMPHSGNKPDLFDPEHDKYTSRLLVAKKNRESFMEELKNKLEKLNDDERTILDLRYIQFVSWKIICCYMSYSRTQLHRIKHLALVNFQLTDSEISKWGDLKKERESYEQ